MPLFGKHKHDRQNTAAHNQARYDAQQDINLSGNRHHPTTGVGPNCGTYTTSQDAYSQGHQGLPPHHNQGHNMGPNAGKTGYVQGQPVPGNQAGVGPGANATSTGVPPASHIDTSSDTSRSGGGGRRLEGKAEHAVGSLVGSQVLKERGFQKEQEAGAFKMQSAEIADAERLEKEALMRRERAVAHGAHPDNRHLGGLQNANTLSDVNGS